jgi:hypothetical protein
LDEVTIGGVRIRIMGAQRGHHDGLDVRCCHACDGARLLASALSENARNVIAIAQPFLDGVARREAVATIVEDAPDEERVGL